MITQNVDGLHEAAGSRNVIPLHGRGYRVQCMSCGAESCRGEYHATLAARNPAGSRRSIGARDGAQALRPDADAGGRRHLGLRQTSRPAASAAPASSNPRSRFFGDVVPKDRVEACSAALDDADGLLCIGTSLAVYSAFRFARRARETVPRSAFGPRTDAGDTEDFPGLVKVNAGVAALAEPPLGCGQAAR